MDRQRDRRVAGPAERLDALRRAPRRGRRGCAGRRTRGRRRRRPRRPSGSSATGRMPLPCLPVDSAISCSPQRPKLAIGGGDHEGELVAALQGQLAHHDAQPQARVRAGVVVARAVLLRHLGARSSSASTFTPASAAGHEPEVGQHRVAPADVGVVLEHAPEAVLVGRVHQRAAGSVTATKRLPSPPVALEEVAACARASRSCRPTSTRR